MGFQSQFKEPHAGRALGAQALPSERMLASPRNYRRPPALPPSRLARQECEGISFQQSCGCCSGELQVQALPQRPN